MSKTASPEEQNQRSQSAPAESASGGMEGIPIWEKALAGVGMALLVAAVGFLLYRGLSGPPSPPEITVRTLGVTPHRAGFLVRLRVFNSGGTTAAQLKAKGIIRRGNEILEAREATLEFVPQHSHRDAGLFFTRDPRLFELEVYPEGFADP